VIYIEGRGDEILVRPGDDSARRQLNRPLHRLFIGSTLSASASEDGGWTLAVSDTSGSQLQTLTAHLKKYNLAFELDEFCASEIRRINDRRIRYRHLMDTARTVKDDSVDLDDSLLKDLSHAFVRDLTQPQRLALQHLLTVENGANFSVPGSGKTSVVLAYFYLLRHQGILDTLLVIGPVSCFRPWEDEYRACFGRPAVTARFPGVARSNRLEMYLTADQYELLLTSYHTAARDQEELIEVLDSHRTLLVLDESHYVKRPVGGQLADAVLRLAPHAARRVILTGTPMPNGLADMWSQITFLWPEDLPLGTSDTYLFKVRRSADDSLAEDVRHKIYPLFFRVSKNDLGLPKPRFKALRCELNPAQARIYKGVAARFLSQTNEAPPDQDALSEWRRARAVRLIQIAVNPTLLRKSSQEFRIPPFTIADEGLRSLIDRYAEFEIPAKINQACAIAREICDEGRRKVIVWSTFVHNLKMLAEHLSDLQPAVIHGGIPYGSTDSEEFSREQEIERFKLDASCRVLIANPAACAESISLHTVCHDAIYLDRSFNCAHYLQSLDRIHRLGLSAETETTYYLLLAKGTVDEVVDRRLDEKMDRLRKLVEPDLPGEVPGYWGEETEEEAERDFSLVEEHIRSLGSV
jgi:SNF2 family DNA or RNA helicase